MANTRIHRSYRRFSAHFGTSAIALAIGFGSTSAFAQNAAPEDAVAIEDIVVTARLRQESLQDTPIAISAVNAKALEGSVVTDITGIGKFLPNVQLGRIAFAGNSLSASIRGISFADLEKTFDPAVGVAIDGVFLGTNTGANLDFSDIELVEVLRGPQGTLFGRNTVGGVINVRRTKPTGEFGVQLRGRIANHNSQDIQAVINLPKLGDAVSVKLFGQRKVSDLFVSDRATGKKLDGRDYYSFGMSVLAEAGPDTTIQGTIEYQKDRSQYPPNVNLTKASGTSFFLGGNICDLTFEIGYGDLGCDTQGYLRQLPEQFRYADVTIPFKSFIDGWAGSLEITTKLGAFNLTSVTGYRDTRDSLLEENTGAPGLPVPPPPAQALFSIPLIVAARDQNYTQFSQEIRIQGDITDSVDLVAGAYYLNTKYNIGPYPYNGVAAATYVILGAPAQNIVSSQDLDSFAVYAESIIKVAPTVRLTLGGRYTIETKKFDTELTLPATDAFTASLKKTFSDPTWRAILDWKPTENVMAYASWSRGFRSGGFNGRGTTPTSLGPYNPERVDSYELGLKADLLDGKVRFGAAVFQADYKDKQEEILRPAAGGSGTETVVQNASSARIRGIELEFLARPTPELTLRASGAHLDAKYRSFVLPDLSQPGAPLVDVSASRNFRRAPRYTFNAGLDYLREIGSGNSVNLTIDYAYTDDSFVSAISDTTGARRDVIKARGAVDASLALIHSNDKIKNLRIAAYGKDLFSNDGGRLGAALDGGIFYFGVLTQNREYGLELSVSF